MATLTKQNGRSLVGAAITLVAASGGGDKVAVPQGQECYLLVVNGGVGSINVTLDPNGNAFNATAIPNTVIAVPAGATKLILITDQYRNPADSDLAAITYSGVTTVTVAALQL